MAKKGETLEEGLDRSASKRHLTGKERHRYIGGALHNLGKSKPRHKGDEKHPRASRPAKFKPPKGARYDKEAYRKHGAYLPLGDDDEEKKKPAPKRKPYVRPTITKTKTATRKAYTSPSISKREHLNLTVKLNSEASKGKPYSVYSIYKTGSKTPHTSQLFRKQAAAKHEAKILMDESKEGVTRKRF